MTNKDQIKLKAFPVSQNIGKFLVASIDAKDLCQICYSDVRAIEREEREITNLTGIQRELRRDRVTEIRDYLLNDVDACFPTAIIVSVDEKCAEFDAETGLLTLKAYEPENLDVDDQAVPIDKIAKIIDGQHRLAGFYSGWGDSRKFDFNRKFELNVSIFVGIDISLQARIFATVNLAQTKVNKNLVYDLESLAKYRNPFKTCHNVAVAMDKNEKSPLYMRIKRLGIATPGRTFEPLTQTAFVESLVKFISKDPKQDRRDIIDRKKLSDYDIIRYPFRRFFISGDDGDLLIYKALHRFFSAVSEKWPNAWGNVGRSGSLITRVNAFKALMRFLRENYFKMAGSNSTIDVPEKSEFVALLAKIPIKDEHFTSKIFLPGAGGESSMYKVLSGKLSIEELIER